MDQYQHFLEQMQELLHNTVPPARQAESRADREKPEKHAKKSAEQERAKQKKTAKQEETSVKPKKAAKKKKAAKQEETAAELKTTAEQGEAPGVPEPGPNQERQQESGERETMGERDRAAGERRQPEAARGPLAPDRSGPDIQPVYGLPVPENLQQQLRGLYAVEQVLREAASQLRASDGDIYFENYPYMIPAGNRRLLAENPLQSRLPLHDMCYPWGQRTIQDAKPRKPLPGAKTAWRYPTLKEALPLAEAFSSLGGESLEYDGETLQIAGITILNPGESRASQAVGIKGSNLFYFGSQGHVLSIDVQVMSLMEEPLASFVFRNRMIPLVCTEPVRQQLRYLYELQECDGLLTGVTDGENEYHLQWGEGKLPELLGRSDFAQFLENRTHLSPDAPSTLPADLQEQYLKDLLAIDEVRADITPVDFRQLDAPNGGVWELWEEPREGWELAGLSSPVYARNPKLDVQESGVVGIDFGTKSTVVVAMNGESGGEAILPVRIGTGRYEQKISGQDYENPTVEAFLDLEKFRADYERDPGRPLTHWSDLTISYTAAMDRENQPDTRYYASYFSELKQWAGDSRRNVRIRDQRAVREQDRGVDQMLPPYLELKPGDLDPIEYYAYYIGLYINNMRTRRIYLEYLLSFPVTYSREVRERILESFRRGLKRSLPRSIQEDPACMEQFSVAEGAGEPAAYAVCALQEYGFTPQPGEKVYFGIFDFGGGTTDFDFGLWRRADGPRERRYRYVIEHFGDSGDRYLGGENLLGKLAYCVFWENRDQLLQERISFTRPPEEPERPGSELLVSDSQEAHTNTRRLVEALRPLWERHPDYQRRYADGILKIDLYRGDGSSCPVELRVDAEALEDLLRDRIRRGVREFFNAFRSIFDQGRPYEDSMKQLRKTHLFLAGNSSKSEILQDVFREEIERENQLISNLLMEAGQALEDEEFFELFFPLGTEESEEQLRARTGGGEPQRVFRPSGKTGVAVGLLQCREGGKIKVINRQTAQGPDREIPFRYWIGDEDGEGMFRKLLSRDSAYGQWEEYYDAGARKFEFYCTTSPSAQFAGTLRVDGCRLFHLSIPESAVNEDWVICLRPVGPDKLEYAVAESKEAAARGELKCEPKTVDLTIP